MGDWEPSTFKEFLRHFKRTSARLERHATALRTRANLAQQAADGAAEDAATALASANGKNTNYYSVNAPSAADLGVQGDLWFQITKNADGTSGTVVGMFTFAGGVWISQVITSQVIGQLDAGKITTGSLTGVTITGVLITGGTFRTAAAGQRTETTAVGLKFYNDKGAVSGNLVPDLGNTRMLLGLYAADNPDLLKDYILKVGPKASGLNPAVAIGVASDNMDAAFPQLWTRTVRDADSGRAMLNAGHGRMFEVLGLGMGQTLSTTSWTLLTTAFQSTPRIDDGMVAWNRASGTLTFSTAMRILIDVAFAVLPASPDRANRGIQLQCNSTTVDKKWVEASRSGSMGKKENSGNGTSMMTTLDMQAGDVLRIYVNSSQTGDIGTATAGTVLDTTWLRLIQIL